jgi:hypothetical protein
MWEVKSMVSWLLKLSRVGVRNVRVRGEGSFPSGDGIEGVAVMIHRLWDSPSKSNCSSSLLSLSCGAPLPEHADLARLLPVHDAHGAFQGVAEGPAQHGTFDAVEGAVLLCCQEKF